MSDTPAQQPSSSGPGGPDPERPEGQERPAGQGQVPPPQWTGGRDAQTGAPQGPAAQASPMPGQQQYPAGPQGQQQWQGPGPVPQPGGAAAFGAQPPQQSRGRRVLVTVAGILAFVIAAALVRWGFASFGGPSKQELVDEGVAKISEQTTFPKQVDSITTWTGVEAEDEAIHYRYSVDADPTAISEQSIRDSVLSNLCSTTATRDILEEDIAMRYSYVFPGSDQTVDLEFTNDDC
ncbi:hypothetical protein [Curtobacterium sp. MCSS17_015]|uniref:hypothetical protein n=1 Tax=Curtobacterium sp. MCSS17_015 TaxID=2175666 RepID=UPI0011B4176C|nr:hypothetical protein [Curtobacterium sp. MCSS17_015]WIB27425.1 hypothetical protein DEJ18_04830 [Curtobacterium sp. MCSS17_015]